jgi:hypothetical protein
VKKIIVILSKMMSGSLFQGIKKSMQIENKIKQQKKTNKKDKQKIN